MEHKFTTTKEFFMKPWKKVVVSILGEGEEIEIFKTLKEMSPLKDVEFSFVTLVRSLIVTGKQIGRAHV